MTTASQNRSLEDEHRLIGIMVRFPNIAGKVCRQMRPVQCHEFTDSVVSFIFGTITYLVDCKTMPTLAFVEQELRERADDPLTPNPNIVLQAISMLSSIADSCPADITEKDAAQRAIVLAEEIKARHGASLTPLLDEFPTESDGGILSSASFSSMPGYPDPPKEMAFHGLAGRIVRAIEPHTEADSMALLIQLLVSFGNVIGRGPHFLAEADYHALNLFSCLVGPSAKGRKGTSSGHIRKIFSSVDNDWGTSATVAGLSSGEGLIWAVRDPIEKKQPVKEKNRVVDYETVIEDHGIKDKRLLVVESEFASVLKILAREGNTLSALIRQAWESGNLQTLTKNSPAKSTNAHISILGHITKDELLRYLNSTEAGNGFANRFLWICVRRSKLLPEGGRISEVDFDPILEQLKTVLSYATTVGELRRDEAARVLWNDIYAELSEGKPGLLGSVTARAEPQVMRLACIYALLDCSAVIRSEHLHAALAVWDYSFASAQFIFGDSLGDPLADEILFELRCKPDGLTSTQISGIFSKNTSAQKIQTALNALLQVNLIHHQKQTQVPGVQGRPAVIWYPVVSPK